MNAWPVGGTNWRGSSQIRQRFSTARSEMSNCVPQAVQMRRLSVLEVIRSDGGPGPYSYSGSSKTSVMMRGVPEDWDGEVTRVVPIDWDEDGEAIAEGFRGGYLYRFLAGFGSSES